MVSDEPQFLIVLGGGGEFTDSGSSCSAIAKTIVFTMSTADSKVGMGVNFGGKGAMVA